MGYAVGMRVGRLAGKAGEGSTRHDAAPMRSPVNWALLGLIIERPSYAYDLAQRFERRYGATLPLSNVGHIYTALGALGDRGLAEEIPGTRQGRQPRPRYRATEQGLAEYRDWLVSQVCEESRRRELFVLALAPLAGEANQLLEVIERCEHAALQAGLSTPIAADQESIDPVSTLMRQLIDEQNRLAVGARLAWIEYLRGEIERRGHPR
jgi:DNA-binding PadR family transcriptional regulator